MSEQHNEKDDFPKTGCLIVVVLCILLVIIKTFELIEFLAEGGWIWIVVIICSIVLTFAFLTHGE